MDQNEQKEMRFVILTQEILSSKELTPSDKLVFARITGFEKFFESPASTAEILGLTELIVQRAKRKLVAMGYVSEIGNTGHGKIYQANLWKTESRYDFKVTSDVTSKSQQILLESNTENKKRIKKETKGENDNDKPVEKSYGREDLNQLVELWKSETGIDISKEQNQRRQLYNLVRKYGLEATRKLVKRVGIATRSRDRFAPQIATPSDLTGKYGKLQKLELWENRNKFAKPFGSPAVTPKMKMPNYNGAWDDQTDEERAKVSEMMRQARAKLF